MAHSHDTTHADDFVAGASPERTRARRRALLVALGLTASMPSLR